MPINRDEIIKLVTELAQAENLKVTVKESAKGACVIGGTAFVGSIIGGPPGLALGGMLGSIFALYNAKGKYRSAVDVILFDMTPAQHEILANSVQEIIRDLRVEDFTVLLPLVMANVGVKELIIKEVVSFIQSEMHMQIAND